VSQGWNAQHVIHNYVRGYIKGNEITFYIGERFEINAEAVDQFRKHIKGLKSLLHLPEDMRVHGGVRIGEVGKVWPPIRYYGTIKEFIDRGQQ
jgi:hypothetical protein